MVNGITRFYKQQVAVFQVLRFFFDKQLLPDDFGMKLPVTLLVWQNPPPLFSVGIFNCERDNIGTTVGDDAIKHNS